MKLATQQFFLILILTLTTIVLMVACSEASAAGTTSYTTRQVFDAVVLVESTGNDDAYNPIEQAAGPAQIRPIALHDVNRILEHQGRDRRYTLQDRYDREKSYEMFVILTTHYEGTGATPEERARRWNGGTGWRDKPQTVVYWNKVRKHLTGEP